MEIKHDIHTHTTLSRCCYDPKATVENYVKRAAELGLKILGLSNHLWDETVPGASSWYQNQSIGYGLQQKTCIPADTCGVKVLNGTETEYYVSRGILGMTAETAVKFDYILVPHTHMHMRNNVMRDTADCVKVKEIFAERIAGVLPELSAAQVEKMANALGYREMDDIVKRAVFFEPTVDMVKYASAFMRDGFNALTENREFQKIAARVPVSIAHPFYPCGFDRETRNAVISGITDDEYREAFRKAKKLNVSIEINIDSYSSMNDPLIKVMRLALDEGCTFTFGTDTHSLKGLDEIQNGAEIADAVGIKEENLAEFVR